MTTAHAPAFQSPSPTSGVGAQQESIVFVPKPAYASYIYYCQFTTKYYKKTKYEYKNESHFYES